MTEDNSRKALHDKILTILKDVGPSGLHIDNITNMLGFESNKTLMPRLKDLQNRLEIQELKGHHWTINIKKKDDGTRPIINLPGEVKFTSYKNSLQEYCGKKGMAVPVYEIDRSGVSFYGKVRFSDVEVCSSKPFQSSKEAHTHVAFEALQHLGYLEGAIFEMSTNKLKRKSEESILYNPQANSKQQKYDDSSINSSESSITFKSKLNDYAVKKQLSTPIYNSIPVEGGFISTVTVGNDKYKSISSSRRRKEAEQSAAQVALNVLTGIPLTGNAIGLGVDDVTAMVSEARKASVTGEFKCRLQELCQKIGKGKPTYLTKPCDSDEQMFMSIVTVEGIQYAGPPVLRKKTAEARAAEEALKALESIVGF